MRDRNKLWRVYYDMELVNWYIYYFSCIDNIIILCDLKLTANIYGLKLQYGVSAIWNLKVKILNTDLLLYLRG